MPEKIIGLSEECPHCREIIKKGEKHECSGTFITAAQSDIVDTPTNGYQKLKPEKEGER